MVMDDEKYFLLHNQSIAANRGFYTSDPNAAPPEVNLKSTEKFWSGFAISKSGIGTPFFAEQQQAVTQTTYLNARLMPLIEKYHHKKKVSFWPDLARSHYALKIMEYLNQFCTSTKESTELSSSQTWRNALVNS